jgi:hypothetical protein
MLAETRSVDDQVEWLDDKRILYTLNNIALAMLFSLNIQAVWAYSCW